MRKMKMDLEQLEVESFETSGAHGRGTVLGRMPDVDNDPPPGGYNGDFAFAPATYPECPSPLCVDTPLASCDGSCRPGCGATQQETVVVTG